MAERYHYFFAVKLPNEVKAFIGNWIERNKREFPFKRWVHEADYHITLAFLGFAEDEMKAKAVESMATAISDIPPFSLTLTKIGTFGPAKSPRIFWTGVNESQVLNDLQKQVYQHCIEAGFQLDKKPFRPHITLARKWEGEQPFEKGTATPIVTEDGKEVSFQINEVVLYETHLDKAPKYKEYAVFPLINKK
ncbi:2'-5' RNA ligase [Ureibacillus xyleni]|uniref:RNA 2',3'-cyclic phosphodiesterase n=1 Tax=Ureibacillus xyleni TaxID=614648 RepID=A0A285SS28_9BACL|nr:RNA 2',3'-cyclic phosphodiesterase [Ureibacillus xyleni]SOC11072.1 2'-5' RNA ligase [Ureibacillus xyleni]